MAGLSPFAWSTTLRKPAEVFAFCQKVAEFLRAVSKLEILRGHFVEVEWPSGATGVNAPHQLGRPYKGVIVVASGNASATPALTVLPATEAEGLGIDSSKVLALGSIAVFASTVTITLWVF